MNVVLFDDPLLRTRLLPFTFTRPVAALRIGILTIAEKWEKIFGAAPSYLTEPYLAARYPLRAGADTLFINGALCPDDDLLQALRGLDKEEALVMGEMILGARTSTAQREAWASLKARPYAVAPFLIDAVWKIFRENGSQLRADFKVLTAGRTSRDVGDVHSAVYNAAQVFVEEGVQVRAAVINAENGPVYLGRNTLVQEGALIRGPLAVCEGSVINMGAKLRGDNTVGPYSKVGGEMSNTVILGHSNKAHDGFLGNSVLGEWCNIGADTNTSNLKNNYEEVKLWSYATSRFEETGLQFCGLLMGDHSKCGINTMFNTGTIVGVSANVHGAGFPRNFIPSFSWGGPGGYATYTLEKALATATRVMARRDIALGNQDHDILKEVFERTRGERYWEKR